MAGAAMALDNTLTVTASVLGTCQFSTATSTLDFGVLDPSSGADVPGTATTQFWCTKGVITDAFTAGNGANYASATRQMKNTAGTELIPYTLTLIKDSVANAGPGTLRTLTIDGGVQGADYIAKSAGSYSDTVAISVLP